MRMTQSRKQTTGNGWGEKGGQNQEGGCARMEKDSTEYTTHPTSVHTLERVQSTEYECIDRRRIRGPALQGE